MGHLMKHYERGTDENGEYIKFGNRQIDLSRTHLNYNLAPDHGQLDFMQKRLREVYVLKRKDVNVMCSWVVTVPKELPEEFHAEFFQRTYNFLRNRYSPDEKNIISSYVHMDEATPHMHFSFIPVVYDAKKGREKVSAKEVINRTDLKTFHRDLQAEMDRFASEYGTQYGNLFQCNVLNGATAGGNKSIEEYKAELLAELNEQENSRLGELMACSGKEASKIEDLSKRRVRLKKDVVSLETEKSMLGDEITALVDEIEALKGMKKIQGNILSGQQVKRVKTENIMFDSERVKISKNDLEDLLKSALVAEQAEQLFKTSRIYLQKAEGILRQAEKKKKEPLKERIERLELEKRLEVYNRALNRCPKDMLKVFHEFLKAEDGNKAVAEKKSLRKKNPER